MTSTPSTSQSYFHQFIPADPSEKFLLCSKDKNSFRVGCSKALLNCLLQRRQFLDDVKLTLDPLQLETILFKLHLETFFKIRESAEFLSSETANALGSILAAHETLLHFNVFLRPIDNTTYTVLVEKPSGFICLINNGWVVMRNIRGIWLELDRRESQPKELSETYLCMIIKQLLVDDQPVFWISGAGFSRRNPGIQNQGQSLTSSQQPGVKTGVNMAVASPSSPQPSSPQPRSPQPRPPKPSSPQPRSPQPRPPQPSSPQPRPPQPRPPHANLTNASVEPPAMLNQIPANICRLQNELNRLEIASSQATKKTKIKTETRVSRSRSEVRTEMMSTSSGYLEPCTQSEASFDWEWPPLLPSVRTRSRRARSSSRARPQSQLQLYRPPTDVVGKNTREEKVVRHESRRDKAKKKEPEKESVCCICLESFPDYALIPCGHQCLCINCKKQFFMQFAVCPICNKKVTGALKIFKT